MVSVEFILEILFIQHTCLLDTKSIQYFKLKDVNHRLDDAGWTTTISGIMRTTLNQLFIESDPNIKTEEKKCYKKIIKIKLEELRKSKQR